MRLVWIVLILFIALATVSYADNNTTNPDLNVTCESFNENNTTKCYIDMNTFAFLLNRINEEEFGRLSCSQILDETSLQLDIEKNTSSNLTTDLSLCQSNLSSSQGNIGEYQNQLRIAREDVKKANSDMQLGVVLAVLATAVLVYWLLNKGQIKLLQRRKEHITPTGVPNPVDDAKLQQEFEKRALQDKVKENERKQAELEKELTRMKEEKLKKRKR